MTQDPKDALLDTLPAQDATKVSAKEASSDKEATASQDELSASQHETDTNPPSVAQEARETSQDETSEEVLPATQKAAQNEASLTPSQIQRRTYTMLFSIMLIATNGVIYELLIAGYSSYLLGDSITQFSLTIGVFMSSMGVGSWLTQRFDGELEVLFVRVELWLAAIGGPAVLLLALAHIYTRVYVWVMFSLIICLGILIGFEIPLVTRIVHRYGSLKKAIANVLSFDYIGALAGSIAFPLFLLPVFGFTRTSFLIALVNLAVAFLNLRVFQEELRAREKSLWFFAMAIGAGLLVGLFFSTGWIETARQQASGQALLYLRHTPYQNIRFVQDNRSPRRPYRLFINSEHQFSSHNEHRYHEALVHPPMSIAPKHHRVLILGGGDGLALREVWRYRDVREVVMVDLDPAMTRFGRTHPIVRRLNQGSMDDPRLRLVHQDAFVFLRQNKRPFDVIIIDLPVPTQIALSKLYTVSFYRTLRQAITPQGAISTEAATLDPLEHAPFWCLVQTQRHAQWHVSPYLYGTMAYTLMTHKAFSPKVLRLQVPTRYLTNAMLQHSFSIPPDTKPTHTPPINTLETHHLMSLILAMR